MNFVEYCRKNNINLLHDDIKFIRESLNKVPKTQKRGIMLRYIEIWIRVEGECENALRGHNLARRSANLYLTHLIKNRDN